MERVFGVSYPDPLELEKAKKMLKVRQFVYHAECRLTVGFLERQT